MKKKDTSLGTSNFKRVIEENRYYVDKTMLVRHVMKGQGITLLCRPRRFAENFYHAFFLGLFAGLEHRYTLRSDREEGYGRYDICLTPKDPAQRGIVIEIKSPETKAKETLASALQAAKDQLALHKYDAGLREAGVTNVLRLAIAVQGKRMKLAAV